MKRDDFLYWDKASLCVCPLPAHSFTPGILGTDLSTSRWNTVLMSGLGPQTATLVPTTAAPGPTYQSTTTLRWWEGTLTTYSRTVNSFLYLSYYSIWLAASPDVRRESEHLCFPISVPAALVYSIFRPFVFPIAAICVVRVIGASRRTLFALSRGFNQCSIPEPGHTRTHRGTHTYTHAPRRRQVVLAACEDTWNRWSGRETPITAFSLCHASATPHNTPSPHTHTHTVVNTHPPLFSGSTATSKLISVWEVICPLLLGFWGSVKGCILLWSHWYIIMINIIYELSLAQYNH